MTMDIPIQRARPVGNPAGTRPNVAELAADSRSEQRRILGLSLPSLLLVTALLLIPVGWLFGLSFFKRGVFTFDHYLRMVEHSSYIAIFQTTFSLSILVTLICVLLGYPVAYLLAQLPRRWATLGMALVILPFWTNMLIRTYAMIAMLRQLHALGLDSTEPVSVKGVEVSPRQTCPPGPGFSSSSRVEAPAFAAAAAAAIPAGPAPTTTRS